MSQEMSVIRTSVLATGRETMFNASTPQKYSLPVPWQFFYGTLCGMITTMGAVGNATVIWICLYYRRMRTITNFFIVNLAAADFLTCVLNVPFTSFFILTQNWPFDQGLCTFISFIASTAVVASVFTIMCISIDRYIAIVHPMRPQMGSTVAYVTILLIWFLAALVSLPALLYSSVFHLDSGDTICVLRWYDNDFVSPANFVYQTLYMVITYFVPLFALTFAYSRVANELWGSKSIGVADTAQLESIKSKRKLVKVLIWVMVTFIICWAPYHCWFIITSINPCFQVVDNISHVFTSSYVLAMSNSTYNPIIYIIINNKFRRGFRQVFRWLPCIHWKPSEAIDYTSHKIGGPYNGRNRFSSTWTEITTVKNGGSSSPMVGMNLLSLQHTTPRHNGRTVAAYKNNVKKVHLIGRKKQSPKDREDRSLTSGSDPWWRLTETHKQP